MSRKKKSTNWLVAEIRAEKRAQESHKNRLDRNSRSGPVTIIKANETVTITRTPMRCSKVATDKFLETYKWRRVRMEAIKLHGARCQCCGATPKDGITINVDHIKPRKTHPELALSLGNLQVLCNVCNHGKGNWDQTDWRST